MALFIDANTEDMKSPPRLAYVVVGTPPSSGGTTALIFGVTIRVKNKDTLPKFRFDQLKSVYNVSKVDEKEEFWKYSHST